MGCICAIYGCNNHSRHGKEKGITFHRFPKDLSLCKRWVQLCKRKDEFKVEYARICSIHFAPGDFQESLRHRLLDYHPKNARNLIDVAVPSQHLYSKDVTPGKILILGKDFDLPERERERMSFFTS